MEKAHMDKFSIYGDSNIGLFALITDNYCLIGNQATEEDCKKVEDFLKVPVHKISIAGTSLIGVFCAANNNKLLVPHIAYDEELKALDELGIEYEVIQSKVTALGNSIIANDKTALISKEFSLESKNQIRDALGVEKVHGNTIAGTDTVGSVLAINEKGILAHRDSSDDDLDFLEEIFDLPAEIGTVNMGSPYIKSGILVNKNGYLIGKLSGGPEIQRADMALGFIE